MAKSFLKKNPQKGALAIAEKSLVRSAGTVGAAFAANNLLPKLSFVKAEYRGLAMLAIGMATEIMVDNDTVRSFGEGVTTYGALQSTGDILLKTNKSKIGLSGLAGDLAGVEEGDYQDISGQRQIAKPKTTTAFNWSKVLAGPQQEDLEGIEAEDLEGLEGLEEEESMAGIADSMM